MRFRSITRTTQPTIEPVTLAEAKQHLRVDSHEDDALIQGLVRAAREWVEQYLDRTLVLTQWTVRFDRFPLNSTDDLELPRPPMATAGTATAVALTYTMETGGTATLSTSQYRVDRNSTPGAVKTLYAGTWPAHLEDDNAVTVTWWAGYGPNANDVPAGIKNAILLCIHELYEKRGGGEMPAGARMLLDSYRWGGYR